MMEACRHHGVQGIVFASSGGTIYGDGSGEPLKEDHDKAPLSAYGVVKLAIEHYLQLYHSQFGLKTFSLRISNAYGPGQLKGVVIGSVARFLRNVVEGETIEIWGDGSIVRDYVYIDDIVDAFTRCVLNLDEMKAGSYNIGSGVGHSLNQVIELVSEITGLSARVDYTEARRFDVHSIVLDPSKMTRESGWRPKVNLTGGIQRMFEVISMPDHR
jgi:UDP-glucose 4-epimerase